MADPAKKFRAKRSGARTLGSGRPQDWQRLYCAACLACGEQGLSSGEPVVQELSGSWAR